MDAVAISEQIHRILQSQSFASKGQLRKLLEVLHKNIDSQNNLNPDLVIRELWPEEIRTKRSADVATEMNRLRHALEAYYNEEGKADPITIALPNRAVSVRNGAHEKRWIIAEESNGTVARAAGSRAAEEQQPREQRNRFRTLKALGAIGAVGMLAIAYVVTRTLAIPDQPWSGRMDGSKLIVANTKGEELWSKNFPEGFGPDSYYDKDFGTRIWFADLESRGHTSVLFSYLPAPSSKPHSSTLICYSDRGREKWRWTPGKDLPEVSGPATYKTVSVRVLKPTEKRPQRIAVVSNADPWWGGPSQVALLDSNGKAISEYWHSGGLREMTVADLDGDGREMIIATGVAHGYDHQATLVILDPDRVSGASTEVRPEFQLHGMGVSQERLRLLFARSDLNRASFQFNFAIEPTVQNGNLRLSVQECTAPTGCPIRYAFDNALHLIQAWAGGDEFRSAHDRFFQNGKDAHSLSLEEQAAFLRVRCLVGCKSEFVPVAETYDPATSFENGWTARNNPNGVWSYGYSSGFTDPVTLYDKAVRNGINGPNAQYWLSSSVDSGTSPAAQYNHGPAYDDGNIKLLADEFLLVAGIRGQYSNLIFTAPAAGEYSIAGHFRGAQYGVGTVVGIVADGKVAFSSSVTSVDELVPFRIPLSLQAGSKVVFSVGPGSGTQNTSVAATITKPCALTDRPTYTPTGEIACSGGKSVNEGTR